MATGPKEPVHFGLSLTLAEKWIRETGRETQRGLSDPLPPNGTRVPLLVVKHGSYQVIVADQVSCIAVTALVAIPADVTKKLKELSSEDKNRLSITLRSELTSNSRTGYSFRPSDVTTIDGLQGFMVAQVMKISEGDPSSFNRFCDAVQEVVTVAGKGLGVFGLITASQSPSTTDIRSAPKSLYG